MLNKKGFVLLDALVAVLIVSFLSTMVFSLYRTYELYQESLRNYRNRENERWSAVYEGCAECRVRISNE